MNGKTSLLFLGLLSVLIVPGTSLGAPLFADDFERGSLRQWTGKNQGGHYGEIVVDPIEGDNALMFSATNSYGDIFTARNVVSDAGGWFQLSFDYLGTCEVTNEFGCGGYVGFSYGLPDDHSWLTASRSRFGANALVDDGTWRHYTLTFQATPGSNIHLMFEDFEAGGTGAAGDVYFDNIMLTAVNNTSVPEPGTLALLGLGLAGLGFSRRRKLI